MANPTSQKPIQSPPSRPTPKTPTQSPPSRPTPKTPISPERGSEQQKGVPRPPKR